MNMHSNFTGSIRQNCNINSSRHGSESGAGMSDEGLCRSLSLGAYYVAPSSPRFPPDSQNFPKRKVRREQEEQRPPQFVPSAHIDNLMICRRPLLTNYLALVALLTVNLKAFLIAHHVPRAAFDTTSSAQPIPNAKRFIGDAGILARIVGSHRA